MTEDKEAQTWVQVAIWTMRILLPLFGFWIYFRLQNSRSQGDSQKNKVTRDVLLMHRNMTKGDAGKPDSMATLRLIGNAEAPNLFAAPKQRESRGAARKERASKRKSADENDGDEPMAKGDSEATPSRPRKEKNEDRAPAPEKPSKDPPKADTDQKEGEEKEERPAKTTPKPAPTPTPPHAPDTPGQDNDYARHTETLVNFMALNKLDKRAFFVEGAPPPPPPKLPEHIDPKNAKEANDYTLSVLKGAHHYGKPDIGPKVYQMLLVAGVDIDEAVWQLLVELALLGNDKESATNYLMEMETSGHQPSEDLIGTVMAYKTKDAKKAKPETAPAKPAEAAVPATGASLISSTLNPMAGEFVPGSLPAADLGTWAMDETMTGNSLRSDAMEFVPGGATDTPDTFARNPAEGTGFSPDPTDPYYTEWVVVPSSTMGEVA
mmetsp:Transcript_32884/g.85384  ORF Transcript_32884/g.85384 Transcript_32884/m.85384 type:complete len:435 (+) Transcript_32884:123-1427(+)